MQLAMNLMKEYLGNENIQNKFENSDKFFPGAIPLFSLMITYTCVTAAELSVTVSKKSRTINKKLNNLLEIRVINMNGNKHEW